MNINEIKNVYILNKFDKNGNFVYSGNLIILNKPFLYKDDNIFIEEFININKIKFNSFDKIKKHIKLMSDITPISVTEHFFDKTKLKTYLHTYRNIENRFFTIHDNDLNDIAQKLNTNIDNIFYKFNITSLNTDKLELNDLILESLIEKFNLRNIDNIKKENDYYIIPFKCFPDYFFIKKKLKTIEQRKAWTNKTNGEYLSLFKGNKCKHPIKQFHIENIHH